MTELEIFRLIAKEFDELSDEEIMRWLALVRPAVSRTQFRRLLPQAVAYLAAHRIKLARIMEEAALGYQQVASISEDGSSESYVNDTPNLGAVDTDLDLTKYGKIYKSMRQGFVRT